MNTLMKNHLPPDFDDELDGDAVWNLIDQSSSLEPSGSFTQDTLRRSRLEETGKSSWWQKIFTPIGLVSISGTAVAAIALMVALKADPTPVTPPPIADHKPAPTEEWSELEDQLASALLVTASEDPSLFSDEELVALLF